MLSTLLRRGLGNNLLCSQSLFSTLHGSSAPACFIGTWAHNQMNGLLSRPSEKSCLFRLGFSTGLGQQQKTHASTNADVKVELVASDLVKNDDELKKGKENKTFNYEKWSKPASDQSVEKTAKKLIELGHKATVVSDASEVIKALDALLPAGASVGFGYSKSFEELGLTEYFKSRKDLGTNFRVLALKAEGKGDQAAAAEARRQGAGADYFFTSLSSVAETGEFMLCDLSGSRVSGVFAAKNVVYVVGANKVVPDYKTAVERMETYHLALESARCRVAYKAAGIKASAIKNIATVKGANPFATQRHHIIFVKGKSLGY